MAPPLLNVEDLWLSYDRIHAVRGVSFTVGEGEIVTLIGANGAGKSSILQAISGLLPATRGRIALAGEDLPPHDVLVTTQKDAVKLSGIPDLDPTRVLVTHVAIDFLGRDATMLDVRLRNVFTQG